MMKSIIPFILSTITVLCFQNCGVIPDVQETDQRPDFSTDPTFEPYIQEFEAHYNRSTADIPIAFDDLDPSVAGVCYRSYVAGSVRFAYIKIDRNYWPKMSEYQKLNLIFHELGHCALNRDHVKSDSVRVCPTSFMYEQVLDTSCIRSNINSYIQEMFSGR